MSGGARLAAFLRKSFAPGLHLGFSALWCLSLQGTLLTLHPEVRAWRFDLSLLATWAALLLALFFIRVVDEVKDLDYDREHNPDRLLVAGVVSQGDMRLWGALGAALALAAAGALVPRASAWPLAIVALDLAHTLLLVQLERRSAAVREGVFLNLLVTYPVNVLLSVFVCAATLGGYGLACGAADVLVVLAYAAFFLHYEFARKLVWPSVAPPGTRSYSLSLGPRPTAVLTWGFTLAAVGLVLSLLRPWAAPLSARALSCWGLLLVPLLGGLMSARFLARRDQPVKLTPLASLNVTLFYGLLALQAALGSTLVLGAATGSP